MEASGGILGRLGEKVLGWIALGLLLLIAFAVYQTPAETKQAIWSGAWRSVTWLAFVAALPWFGRLFIGRILETGTNWAGAALVAGFTLVDVLIGLLLISAWPASLWGWLLLLALVGAAATYNFLVADYLADQAGV